jgi:adenylosuccinate lyase
MIPRYERKEISSIWELENKYRTFLDVELSILQTLEESDDFPIEAGTAAKLREAKINVDRINEIEAETKHDVIAFCTSITEQFSPEVSRFFHYGVTSSDIIDTATTIQIKQCLEVILPRFEALLESIKKRSEETKDWVCMGRSHGMNAEPMSFGQKWLSFYAEFKRRYEDFKSFYETELTGQFSGAVGNYTILNTEMEKKALTKLDLKVEPVSTQVIPRDRIAKLITINGLIASAIERMAVEIRHLHHSDIGELHEGFTKGQKGSSIMPHKKNPISGENLTGLARTLRSHVQLALENCVLWHERDISHSSTERMYLPDNLGLLLYGIDRLNSTVENLVFHKEVIESKTQKTTAYLSSFYLHLLLKNTQSSRADLYKVVQKAAFDAPENDSIELFQKRILAACEEFGIDGKSVNDAKIETLSALYLKNADHVFERTV